MKTDWLTPTTNQWIAEAPGTSGSTVNGQNNGVIVFLMTPTTSYGQLSPPVFRNIFVEDQPRVLFSLKIVPPVNCPATGTACNAATLVQPSQVSLNVENLYSPVSLVQNSIGLQTLPDPYPTQTNETIRGGVNLSGRMQVNLINVFIQQPYGLVLPLQNFDGAYFGNISTHGSIVQVNYGLGLP